MAGDPKYLARCGKMFNGQIASEKGPRPTDNYKEQKDLDKPRVQSRLNGDGKEKNPGTY